MYLRSMTSVLLIASLAMVTIGRPVVRQEETPNQAKEETLTPDEEREARALADDFIERLEKSEDVTPLVKELFVEDFTERLRSRMDSLFPLAATPELAAQLSSDDILRAYAASINCIYVIIIHYTDLLRRRANERAKRGEPKNSEAERVLSIEELIPPKLINLIESDPALATLLSQEMKKENEKREKETADIEPAPVPDADRYEDSEEATSIENIIPFKNAEQLCHYILLAEQGVALLREHINSFPNDERPPVRESWRKLMNESSDDDADDDEDSIKPRLDILTDEFMGYSPGTRLICANVMMFHIIMVRTSDGRLKVLDFHMLMD